MKKDDNNILGNGFNSKNKIEGTPILKLAMVKRLKVNKNLQKITTHKKIRQKICQKTRKKFVKKNNKNKLN